MRLIRDLIIGVYTRINIWNDLLLHIDKWYIFVKFLNERLYTFCLYYERFTVNVTLCVVTVDLKFTI